MNTSFDELKKDILKASEKISALRKPDSFVFPLFTDLHSKGDDDKLDLLCDCLKEVTDKINCDMVVSLGDNLDMLGRYDHISTPTFQAIIKGMVEKINASVNCPTIYINGNHDGIGTDFFESELWNGLVMKSCENAGAVYGDEGSYFYIDSEKSSTRFVILSVPCGSDFSTEHPTPVWAFGDKQLEWLKNCALDVSGNVIILMHVPFYYFHIGHAGQLLEVWDGEKVATSYIPDLCGRIEDIEKAASIVNEFSQRENTNLVACFSGHTHIDEFWEAGERKGEHVNHLPCKQVVSSRTIVMNKQYVPIGFAIDIAVWTPSANSLQVIRIGDGDDRKIL